MSSQLGPPIAPGPAAIPSVPPTCLPCVLRPAAPLCHRWASSRPDVLVGFVRAAHELVAGDGGRGGADARWRRSAVAFLQVGGRLPEGCWPVVGGRFWSCASLYQFRPTIWHTNISCIHTLPLASPDVGLLSGAQARALHSQPSNQA